MDESRPVDDDASVAELVHTLAGRFEAAWKAGGEPSIEEHAAAAPAAARAAALRELVIIDAACRRRAGHAVAAADYFHRFPELARGDRGLLAALGGEKGDPGETQALPPPISGAREDSSRGPAGAGAGAAPPPPPPPRDRGPVDAQPEPAPFERPMPRIPGYDLVRELSRGGQGIVYQAVQRSTQRKVAIKVLLEGPYPSEQARRRFEREVELVAHLKHPNIIAVFDSGVAPDGRLYYVMDYVRGTPVTRYVRERKLGLDETLALFANLCDAVNHAHQKGVIHRDLKPSNVLVDGEGNLRVLDFGLAKAVTERAETLATLTGQVMGTLPYMSPEQTAGNPDLIDTRTDVYALGVMLYELLTGAYPYPVAGQIGEVLNHICESEPRSLTRSWTQASGIGRSVQGRRGRGRRTGCPIDDEVETVVLKALAKERARRYQSAGELARDVRLYLADEPIEAKRDSGLYVLRKALRKYRAPVAVATTVAVLLAAASVIAWTQRSQAVAATGALQAQKDRADDHARRAERSAANALAAARLAEERLAEALMATGDSRFHAGAAAAARDSYLMAQSVYGKLGWPDVGVRASLLASYEASAQPLMGDEGSHKGIGGFAGHGKSVLSVAFSPDGRAALSGSFDRTLKLWDVATGRELHTLAGHTGPVNSVAFSPDGRTALSGGDDGTLKLWDVASGRELRTLAGHSSFVWSVTFSPDGRAALSANSECTLTLWDFSRPDRYAEFKARIPHARTALERNANNPAALTTFGEWWAFRGFDDWAAEFFEKARAGGGGDVPSLTLARCYWKLGRFDESLREFEGAARRSEAPQRYLEQCRQAVIRDREAALGQERDAPRVRPAATDVR